MVLSPGAPVERDLVPVSSIARLTVTLQGIRPLVWRRLEVPIAFSFAELSAVILTAFGWTGRHRHDFLLVDCRIGVPHRETPHDTPLAIDGLADPLGQLAPELASLMPTPPFEDERNVTLAREIERGRLRFLYRYDFADDWRHLVEVDDVAVAEPDIAYPGCLGGCRAAPPEGCGGSAGYEHFCRGTGRPTSRRVRQAAGVVSGLRPGVVRPGKHRSRGARLPQPPSRPILGVRCPRGLGGRTRARLGSRAACQSRPRALV